MSGHVRFDPHPTLPQVGRLTLSNPGKLNAMSVAMWRELTAHLASPQLQRLRAVIVRGEGGTFVSGGDIEEFPSFRYDTQTLRHFHEHIVAPALRSLSDCDVPLIAQIDGACVGGGLEIACACACDLRICGKRSRFGAPIAKLGFPMAPDELLGVAKVAGLSTLAEILLEARLLDAPTAYARQLVQRVVSDEDVEREANDTAKRIAAVAPHVARLHKQMLRKIAIAVPVFNEVDRATFSSYADCADHREGISAFLEKRPPRFTGN